MPIDFTNKNVVAAAVVVGVVVLAGAAIVWGNTVRHSPQIVEQAFMKLASAETLHASAELSLNLPPRFRGRARPLTKVDVVVAGDVARSEDGTPELTGTLKGEARGRGNTFFFDGATSILREAVAFRLTEFPLFLNPSGSLTDRWTYVDVPLLTTHNPEAVKNQLVTLAGGAQYRGRRTIDGTRTLHYSLALTPEQEDELVKILELPASGNRALHTLARLLRANNVEALDLYINSSNQELTQVTAHFVRPLEEGKSFDFALLTLAFTDYGKPVTIDHPEQQAHVRPDVFSALFGTGEVQAVEQ